MYGSRCIIVFRTLSAFCYVAVAICGISLKLQTKTYYLGLKDIFFFFFADFLAGVPRISAAPTGLRRKCLTMKDSLSDGQESAMVGIVGGADNRGDILDSNII